VEGSTRQWQRFPAAMQAAAARHDALTEALVAEHGGVLVRPRGEGDSRFAVFARATRGVSAAAALQRALTAEPWPLPEPLRVRMALHTGEDLVRDGDYYGQPSPLRAPAQRRARRPDLSRRRPSSWCATICRPTPACAIWARTACATSSGPSTSTSWWWPACRPSSRRCRRRAGRAPTCPSR
jgi:hypothetical protein